MENPWFGVERFPNHCQQIYPSTTHRLRLVFNGGVSRGLEGPLKYDQNDFYLITDGAGNRLPSSHILGLAEVEPIFIYKKQENAKSKKAVVAAKPVDMSYS